MAEVQRVKFNPHQKLFFQTVRQRVDQYIKTKKHGKHANAEMVIKTIFMFALFFVPYFALVLGFVHSIPLMAVLSLVLGLGISGIGLSVMHDANHGSYSKNKNVNKWLSYTLNMLGGHYLNWQMQHNTLHHTFTNIDGQDEDIDAPTSLLRFSPHGPHKRIHKLQFLYAWFFYGLLTIMWSFSKDFRQVRRYKKLGLFESYKEDVNKHIRIIVISKILYFLYVLVIPMIFIPAAWWQVLIGFFIAQFTAGLILSAIFQSAHVLEETKFPLPDKTGNMENDWAVHQLYTTANFAPGARIFSWYVGGLNYQVEHHLFPSVCHIHYRHISTIVKQTAEEFNFPYHSQPTFASALYSHVKMLWRLGRMKGESQGELQATPA